MKPIEVLARATTPDGEELKLWRRDGVWSLDLGGSELMSSRAHGSERALATLACAPLAARARPRVLVGGLGFGYTLRAALDALPAAAEVVVAELFDLVIAANRGEAGALAGRPLDDPRTVLVQSDVHDALAGAPFDAILLDVDNGPEAFTLARNRRLYSEEGLARISRSLAPDGILAVWSAGPDPAFVRRLEQASFAARAETARGRDGGRGNRHTIFLARRP
jgi:spermidine synthase